MNTINPAMQPGIRVEFKRWQDDTADHAYGFGECPYCGQTGDEQDEGSYDNDTAWHLFFCEDCDVYYTYRARFVHCFEGIARDE